MFSRGTTEPAFVDVTEVGPAVPLADLVPLAELAELAAESFGWDVAANPLGAIDALAVRFGHEVVLDDLGRRCVSREAARRLFAEQAESERRRREVQARNDANFAEQAKVWPGIPADQVPPGMTPAEAMMLAGGVDDDRPRRRRSVLEDALENDGVITYHSLGPVP